MEEQHTPNQSSPNDAISKPALVGLYGMQQLFNKVLSELTDLATIQKLDASGNHANAIAGRLQFAFSYYESKLKNIYSWLYSSREDSNFTYDISEHNKTYLASFVAAITDCTAQEARIYIDELNNDLELQQHVREWAARSGDQSMDIEPRYGRRLGWYALVRVLKPKVVIETGVDKGLGSCVLAAAILRNRQEGFEGTYYGTDINPSAGALLQGKYREAGQILYGDSIESLKKLDVTIDCFINDSDHSAEYEANEYQTVKNKLSDTAIILADNAHSTDKLAQFSQRNGRNFLFFQERPENHWYPGAGIGVSYPKLAKTTQTKIITDENLPTQNYSIAPMPSVAKKRCLFINTYYDGFLTHLYQSTPGLAQMSYAQQMQVLQDQSFGDSDFYSNGMISAGWDSENIIVNCPELQGRWAVENNFGGNLREILLEQVRRYKPDAVYCQDMHLMDRELLEQIRSNGCLIAGQIASSIGNIPIQSYDVLFTTVLPFVEWFRTLGVAAYLQPLAFEGSLLQKLQHPEYKSRGIQCSFTGGIFSNAHKERQALLEYLADKTPIEYWGYGADRLPPDSKIIPRYRGEAWGNTMFNVLMNSKITINTHGECTGCEGPLVKSKQDNTTKHFAVNMRLYEATGCGALLITDYKDNLNEIFEIGKEVVAYRSAEECVELVKYYLKHPEEAERIAKAGQARTLKEHCYASRLETTAEILERKLKARELKKQLPTVDLEKISYGHTNINKTDVNSSLTNAWKSDEIPVKQRALVQGELDNFYKGKVHDVFLKLAEFVKPYVSKNTSILEIGCASGYYYEILGYLLHKNINYTGVDYSESMIKMAKDLYPKAKFQVEDGGQLSFGNQSFDVVISGNVLIHVANYKQHIAETCRVAKNAIILHRTPICKNSETQYQKKFAYGVETVELRFNENELVNEFALHGWHLKQVSSYSANPQIDDYENGYLFTKGV